jgi:hypothetical protein
MEDLFGIAMKFNILVQTTSSSDINQIFSWKEVFAKLEKYFKVMDIAILICTVLELMLLIIKNHRDKSLLWQLTL